jgi:hypothetical protein
MGEPSELKVPTRPVQVELALVGQPPAVAELFLGGVPPTSRSLLAAEVAAMLEDGTGFLPVYANGIVSLCNKATVVWVALRGNSAASGTAGGGGGSEGVPEPVENAEPSEVVTLYDHRHEVRVELAGGGAVDGHVLYTSPEGRNRVVDFLNRSARYLWMWEGTTLYLINKQHVVRVLERDR